MSTLITDTELSRIQAPGLTDSNYGDSVKQQFENIDNNFQRLSNYDFITGKSGSGIRFCNLKLYDENVFTELGSALLDAVVTRLGVDTSYIDWNDPGSWGGIEILTSVRGINFLDYVKENPDISVMYTLIDVEIQDDDNNRAYVCSPGPYMFIDNRYRNINDGGTLPDDSNEYESLLDTSCIVTLTYENDEALFQAINVFPTLYYDSNDKQFKWKVYGNESGIIAQGVQGYSSTTPIRIVAAIDEANENNNNDVNNRGTTLMGVRKIEYILVNDGNTNQWYPISIAPEQYLPNNGDLAIVAGITNPPDVNDDSSDDIANLSNTDMYFSYIIVQDNEYYVVLNKVLGVRSNTYASALVRNLVNIGGPGDTLGCLFIPYRGSSNYDSYLGGAHTAYSIQKTGTSTYDLYFKPITALGFTGGTGTTGLFPGSGVPIGSTQPGWVDPHSAERDTEASMNVQYNRLNLLNDTVILQKTNSGISIINPVSGTGSTYEILFNTNRDGEGIINIKSDDAISSNIDGLSIYSDGDIKLESNNDTTLRSDNDMKLSVNSSLDIAADDSIKIHTANEDIELNSFYDLKLESFNNTTLQSNKRITLGANSDIQLNSSNGSVKLRSNSDINLEIYGGSSVSGFIGVSKDKINLDVYGTSSTSASGFIGVRNNGIHLDVYGNNQVQSSSLPPSSGFIGIDYDRILLKKYREYGVTPTSGFIGIGLDKIELQMNSGYDHGTASITLGMNEYYSSCIGIDAEYMYIDVRSGIYCDNNSMILGGTIHDNILNITRNNVEYTDTLGSVGNYITVSDTTFFISTGHGDSYIQFNNSAITVGTLIFIGVEVGNKIHIKDYNGEMVLELPGFYVIVMEDISSTNLWMVGHVSPPVT